LHNESSKEGNHFFKRAVPFHRLTGRVGEAYREGGFWLQRRTKHPKNSLLKQNL
jgi:hypothetical protein